MSQREETTTIGEGDESDLKSQQLSLVEGLIIEEEEVLDEMRKDEGNTNGNGFEGRAIEIQVQKTVWPKKTHEQHEIGDTNLYMGIARKEGVKASDVWGITQATQFVCGGQKDPHNTEPGGSGTTTEIVRHRSTVSGTSTA